MNKLLKKIGVVSVVLLSVVTLTAQTPSKVEKDISEMTQEEYAIYLANQVPDTFYTGNPVEDIYPIYVLARPKGDRVLLRWAPSEFAPWYLANKYGYVLLRSCEGVVDTLEHCIMPATVEELMERYEPTDSLAGAAAQMLYGTGSDLNQALAQGGANAIVELYEEQQTRFAYAMLLAEIRPDLARDMALMYVDSTAVRGKDYSYIVVTNVPDSLMLYSSIPANVHNEPQDPPRFETNIIDSIGNDGRSLRIFWPLNPTFTTYDIECRYNGGEWKKLNDNPFITLITFESEETATNIFQHTNLEVGTYEYRLCGYDSFGEKSNYSAVHTVVLPDIIPPTSPIIKRFVIDRSVENRIFADIEWRKSIHEDDFVGYDIMYCNVMKDTVWIKLNEEMIATTDSTFRAEVTYLGTGLVTVMAVDTAGNTGPSFPQEMRIVDMEPPAPPTGLNYILSPTGVVLLTWTKNKEKDVSGYQVFTSNREQDSFLPVKDGFVRDTIAIDSIPVEGVMQRYKYYKVRAYDYSGNESDFSEPLRLTRKNYDPPRACTIDSVWMTGDDVNIIYHESPDIDVVTYYVYRRLQGEEISDRIMTIVADSIKDGLIYVKDSPQPNYEKRYFYCIEAVNETGISSERSFESSFLFKGRQLLPVKITVGATYREEQDHVVIAWDIADLTQEMIDDGAYICLYKKSRGEDFFRFVTSINIGERMTTDRFVNKGDTIEYQLRLRTDSGKFSEYSNSAQVVMPPKEEETATTVNE